jgi:uncharacterized protein YjbI with pentapeptide repeats
MKLTTDERLILQEAVRIKRRLNEMADLSGFPDPDSREERIRKAIIAGEIKDLAGKDLSGLDLRRAKFYQRDFTGTNFDNADLRGVYFSQTILGSEFKSVLWNASFVNADASGAVFTSVDLSGSNFTGVNAQDADFAGVSFFDADLSDGDFSSADFRFADFTGAKLDGAIFQDANLNDAKGLPANWHSITIGIPSVFPDGTRDGRKHFRTR